MNYDRNIDQLARRIMKLTESINTGDSVAAFKKHLEMILNRDDSDELLRHLADHFHNLASNMEKLAQFIDERFLGKG